MIDHTAPARAEREEALTQRAWLYVAQIEARCVELSPEMLACIERGRMTEKDDDNG